MKPIIDLRGICCPSNYFRARLALDGVDLGQCAQILLDDGEPVRNVPRLLKSDRHGLIGLKEIREGCFLLEVEKAEAVK